MTREENSQEKTVRTRAYKQIRDKQRKKGDSAKITRDGRLDGGESAGHSLSSAVYPTAEIHRRT